MLTGKLWVPNWKHLKLTWVLTTPRVEKHERPTAKYKEMGTLQPLWILDTEQDFLPRPGWTLNRNCYKWYKNWTGYGWWRQKKEKLKIKMERETELGNFRKQITITLHTYKSNIKGGYIKLETQNLNSTY